MKSKRPEKPYPVLDAFNKYLETAYKRRGYLINQAIILETILDEYIAKYFCQDEIKRHDFLELILWKQVGFMRKKEIVDYILKNNDKGFLVLYPDTIKDLTKIIDYRNAMAHQYLEVSYAAIEKSKDDKSFFVRHNKSSVNQKYDNTKMNEMIELIDKYSAAFYHWQ